MSGQSADWLGKRPPSPYLTGTSLHTGHFTPVTSHLPLHTCHLAGWLGKRVTSPYVRLRAAGKYVPSHLPLPTCHCPPATAHLPLPTCHCPPAASHLECSCLLRWRAHSMSIGDVASRSLHTCPFTPVTSTFHSTPLPTSQYEHRRRNVEVLPSSATSTTELLNYYLMT